MDVIDCEFKSMDPWIHGTRERVHAMSHGTFVASQQAGYRQSSHVVSATWTLASSTQKLPPTVPLSAISANYIMGSVDGNPFSFAGKKTVVIAGSAGIGRGIAELIAQLGGQVCAPLPFGTHTDMCTLLGQLNH